MKIECYILQSFSCLDQLKQDVEQALKVGRFNAEIYYRRIRDEEAMEIGLTGSPTVLLNGYDLDSDAAPGFY